MPKLGGAMKTKRAKRYAVAEAAAVLLAFWLYEFVLPLLNSPNP